jgi:3D (Asp-Asp-Asp) domain-containing protein
VAYGRVRPIGPQGTVGGTPFTATAYCRGDVTASGTKPAKGIVAADPSALPMGSRIRLSGLDRYDGLYVVEDTGSSIRGRRIDLYIRNCREATRFGRRRVTVFVVR